MLESLNDKESPPTATWWAPKSKAASPHLSFNTDLISHSHNFQGSCLADEKTQENACGRMRVWGMSPGSRSLLIELKVELNSESQRHDRGFSDQASFPSFPPLSLFFDISLFHFWVVCFFLFWFPLSFHWKPTNSNGIVCRSQPRWKPIWCCRDRWSR